jgi:hypothetical protein
MQLFTYACCYLMIKIGRPKSPMPTESAALFEIENYSWCADACRTYAELYAA